MKPKNILLTATSIGGAILTGIIFKKVLPSNTTKIVQNATQDVAQNVIQKPETYFKGVPLSKLSELAKQIYHGINCSIDKFGFLVFSYKSNRGNQTFNVQMKLDDAGKLINLGGHYPGQIWSSADELAKRANEIFKFKS